MVYTPFDFTQNYSSIKSKYKTFMLNNQNDTNFRRKREMNEA